MGDRAFLVWHEAYPMGLIGSLRVKMGYRPTAELAVEEMSKGGIH